MRRNLPQTRSDRPVALKCACGGSLGSAMAVALDHKPGGGFTATAPRVCDKCGRTTQVPESRPAPSPQADA